MAPLGDPSDHSDMSAYEFDTTARDEAAKLRSDVCKLRVRLEEIENERNYTAAKANELEEVIRAFKQDHVHEELVKKSLQLAEVSTALDSMRSEIKTLQDEKTQLLRSRAQDRKTMEELSEVLKSLQFSQHDEDEEVNAVLTPEKALDLALRNLKGNIEFLEDEHQKLATQCSTQQKTISQLEKENEMKEVKIGMLEELFRALNDTRQKDEVFEEPKPARQEGEQSSRPRVSRGNRPQMQKCRSWAGLVEGGKKVAPETTDTSRPEGLKNRRSASSRALNEEKSPRQSSSRRKGTMFIVGDQVGEYAGPMVDGKPHGVGTVRFGNGDTYLGEVKRGKLHGKGSMYTKSGTSRGLFKDNVFIG